MMMMCYSWSPSLWQWDVWRRNVEQHSGGSLRSTALSSFVHRSTLCAVSSTAYFYINHVNDITCCSVGRAIGKAWAVPEMSDRLTTIDMGRKMGADVPLCLWGAGSPSNTVWPGPRPTSMPSFIWIHPTVWPQYTNVTDRQIDRQTLQTVHERKRSDSVGRTVLQTLAQKLHSSNLQTFFDML